MSFAYSRERVCSYTWNYTICTRAMFLSHTMMCLKFIQIITVACPPFSPSGFVLNSGSFHEYATHNADSLVDQLLGCFQFGAIIYKSAMQLILFNDYNILLHTFTKNYSNSSFIGCLIFFLKVVI